MWAFVFVRRWETLWVQAGIDKPSAAFWHSDRKSVSHDLNIGILSDCTEGLVCLLPAQIQTKSFKHTQVKGQWARLLGLNKTKIKKKKEMFIVSLLSCPYWQIPNHYSCISTEQSWTLQLDVCLTVSHAEQLSVPLSARLLSVPSHSQPISPNCQS